MRNGIDIGQMDRYLVAQSKTETKSAKGQIVSAWVDAFGFYATQTDNVVAESFSAFNFVAPNTTTFATHWRADLNRTMRLVMDGDRWNIISIHRDRIFMRIDCQREEDLP